jgi:hypothetical protein
MVAYYIDYTSNATIPNDNTVIPSWCTQLRFIAIGGGGGGGGGSGDPDGWLVSRSTTNRQNGVAGSSGTGGGGGGLAAAYINRETHPPPYVIDIGLGGTPGGEQGTALDSGKDGTGGNPTTVKYDTNTTFLTANGGGKGKGGRDPNNDSETTYNTTYTGFGGTGSSNITPKWEVTGNASNQSNDASLWSINVYHGPSKGGTVAYGTAGTTLTNVTVPTIATADTGTSYYIDTANDVEYETRNNIGAGFGQGGIGGINAPNSNGRRGQNGGPGLVRVYFIK